jgi:hypothetical protein
MEKYKLIIKIKDMFDDIPICNCSQEIIDFMDSTDVNSITTRQLFNKIKEFYIDINCGACKVEVIEEFNIIKKSI